MRPPGIIEIILILAIVFIIFGAGKLPRIFEFFGKGMRALRGGKKSEGAEEIKTAQKSKKKAARG